MQQQVEPSHRMHRCLVPRPSHPPLCPAYSSNLLPPVRLACVNKRLHCRWQVGLPNPRSGTTRVSWVRLVAPSNRAARWCDFTSNSRRLTRQLMAPGSSDMLTACKDRCVSRVSRVMSAGSAMTWSSSKVRLSSPVRRHTTSAAGWHGRCLSLSRETPRRGHKTTPACAGGSVLPCPQAGC